MTKKSNKKSTAKTKPDIAIAGAAIIGGREGQEDAWKAGSTIVAGSESPVQILILADGMGGHVGGAKASNAAVDSAMMVMQSSTKPINERLSDALDTANVALADDIRADSSLKGMGCTLIIAALHSDGVVDWISVGDSPMLELGRGVRRLNANHSLAEKIDREVAEGKRSWEEAKNDPERHVLLSALTGKPLRLVDRGSIKLEDDTALILASDGIESLTGREIHEIVLDSASPKDSVEKLLNAIKKKGLPDQDNTSVICHFNGKPTSAAVSAQKSGGFGWISTLVLLLSMVAIAGGAAALLFLPLEESEDTASTPEEPVGAVAGQEAGASSDRSPTVPQSDAKRRLIDSEEFQNANELVSSAQDNEGKRRPTPSRPRQSPARTRSSGTSGAVQTNDPSPAEVEPTPSATEPEVAAEKAETVVEAAKAAAEDVTNDTTSTVPSDSGDSDDVGSNDEPPTSS